MDRAVARGEFSTRTEAIRSALERLTREIRDREIAEEYRRAYTEQPQEEWVGEFGMSLLRSAALAEEHSTDSTKQ